MDRAHCTHRGLTGKFSEFLPAAASTLDRITDGDLPKGDALPVARIAGIQAAKRCAELIPLCHPLPLNHAAIDFERAAGDRLRVVATTRTIERTGVEMEALTGASVAALCIYDMLKAVSHDIVVSDVRLLSKTGGKSDFDYVDYVGTE